MMNRNEVLGRLNSVIQINGHILAVATGNGMSTQFTVEGGADFVLAMIAGRYRQMGQNAFSAYFGYDNANKMVLDFARREVLPMARDCPVVMAVFAQDPNINLYEYLKEVGKYGFSGVINYPTVGLMDGKFRDALEEAGLGYQKEVEMIGLAHFLGLFTVAYVSNEEEAMMMSEAGADVICYHLGITGGGILGANRAISLEVALEKARRIFERLDKHRPGIIKIVSGGPVKTPIDAYEFYENTSCQGFLGGSAIERLPVERAMLNTVRAFKSQGDFNHDNIVSRMLNGVQENVDYVDFMKQYVDDHYSKCIRLKDLAVVTHMSASRLSVLFKEKMGISFTDYLIGYRMEKARQYLRETQLQMKEISTLVGYEDYSQFVKMFKKIHGITPHHYRKEKKEIVSE